MQIVRKYLISAISLVVIAVLLFFLVGPGGQHGSDMWPLTTLDKLSELEFSGGQNFSLKKENGRWFVLEQNTQSLADVKRLEGLLAEINIQQPQQLQVDNSTQINSELFPAGLGSGNATNVPAQLSGLTQGQAQPQTAEQLPAQNASTPNATPPSFGPDLTTSHQMTQENGDSSMQDISILPTTLTLRGDNSWTIAPKVYEKDTGLVYSKIIKNTDNQVVYLDPAFIKKLSRPARYYADYRLFSARPDRVLRIEVVSPGSEVWELAKINEGTFTFLQPERFKGIEVPQAGMEFYLHAILSTQSPGNLIQHAPAELEKPFLQVKTIQEKTNFTTGSEQEEETLTISRIKNSGDYVGYSSYQQAYFMINAQKVEQLARSLLSLRSRPVLPNGVGQVQTAKLTVWNSKGEEQIREFSRNVSGWNEQHSDANLIGVDTVFWRLGTLQTEGRADKHIPADIIPVMKWEFSYNNDEPSLQVTFYSHPTESKEHWVRIAEDGPLYPVHTGAINEILGLLPAPQAARQN